MTRRRTVALAGTEVLVTGGGGGIGVALAAELVRRGAVVTVAGRDPERLAAAARAVPGLGTVPCDITDPAQRAALLPGLTAAGHRIAILVNNAGVLAPGVDRVTEQVQTNLAAPMELTRLFLDERDPAQPATIVNVTAGVAYLPVWQIGVYAATKAGLHSFSRSLRLQLRGTGVRVVEILPPGVDTPMTAGLSTATWAPERFAARAVARLANGEEEIAVGAQTRALGALGRLAPRSGMRLVARLYPG